MRLGVIAAIVFMLLATGLLYSSVTDESLVTSRTEAAMEEMMAAKDISEEGDFGVGNYLKLVGSTFDYFGAMIEDTVYQLFNNPLWVADGWTLVPYYTFSPIVIVFILGLIILLIGILQKSV